MKNIATVAKSNGRVRRSDADLHRAAHKAIWEANHVVFESLPGLIAQIIENETWRSFAHQNFASYALDATTNGLGVNSNQRLWILRCSMDVYGEHIAEWAEVLNHVEQMVRVQAASSGVKAVGSTSAARSLEVLAKGDSVRDKITYLPSRQTAHDGHLMRLRKADASAFRRVVTGKASLPACSARDAAKVSAKTTYWPTSATSGIGQQRRKRNCSLRGCESRATCDGRAIDLYYCNVLSRSVLCR